MQALLYYALLPLVYLLIYSPWWLFYRISDAVFIFVYHIVGYRKKVVMANLQKSFPEKSPKEIKKIAQNFYSYFVDMLLESVRAIGMSKESMLRRCQVKTPEVVNALHAKGLNVIIVTGHYGNTEWAGAAMSLSVAPPLFLTYAPFKNRYFENLIKNAREKFSSTMVPLAEVLKVMVKHKQNSFQYGIIFSADQMPHPEKVYWTTFLNQETAVYWGVEKTAVKFNYPVVFGYIRRPKRGYYDIYMELLCLEPQKTEEGEISEAHTKALEKQIVQYPEIWYWTHKRWKNHPWQQNYKKEFLAKKAGNNS